MTPLYTGFLADTVPPLPAEERAWYRGRRVLLTGAGGSIGSAVARALMRLGVARIVLLESSERALYTVLRRLDAAETEVVTVLGSALDPRLLARVYAELRPELLLHCAALKHVPLLESQAVEAVRQNLLVTEAVLEAALEHGCGRCVLLSTDKAVAPESVMGTTKLLAEQALLRAQLETGLPLQVLRLCNVLGTSGSVAPLFAEQIRRGLPVTLTSTESTRFFLTRRGAVRLLLRAGAFADPMGVLLPHEPVRARVADLAQYMLRRAHRQGPIVCTGLRPGEKLHEQLRWEREISTEMVGGGLTATPALRVEGAAEVLGSLRIAAMERNEGRTAELLGEVRRRAAESLRLT